MYLCKKTLEKLRNLINGDNTDDYKSGPMYRPPKVRPKSNDLEVGIFMAKYSFEFKKKVVLEYLDGKGGALYISKIYGLASGSQLCKWINAYNAFGDEGLMRSRKQIKYSF